MSNNLSPSPSQLPVQSSDDQTPIASQNTPIDPLQLSLLPSAEVRIRELSRDFATKLMLQSKLVASKKKNEHVQRQDVDDALQSVNVQPDRVWWYEALIAVGSLIFGTAIQGFLQEVSRAPSAEIQIAWLIGYFFASIFGLSLFFLGYALISRR